MAKVVNITSKPMDNTLDSVSIRFYLVADDEVNNTLSKRLRVEVTGTLDRDDGEPSGSKTLTYSVEQDSDVGTFGAGAAAELRARLKDLYDQWLIDEGVN